MAFPRQVWRVLLGAALTLSTLALCAGSAAAAFPSVEVSVYPPNSGSPRIVWLDKIDNPENYGRYPIRDRNGSRPDVVVEKGDGISIRQLLAEVELDLGYGAIELSRPSGGTVRIDQDDVNDPNHSPMFYVKDGQVYFLRPSTGPTDYNARDHFALTASSITLRQTPGELRVRVKASRTRIEPGESVKFSASASNGPPGARYIYNWVFDDGESKRDGGSSVTHTFKKAGTRHVVVGVKIAGETRSDSATVKVQVGDPKQSDKDRAGGGDNDAAGAPTSGDATGSSGAGSSYGGGSSSTPYTPSTPSTSATPSTPSTPSADPPDVPGIATDGTTIEGNLLADASEPPPSSVLESAARAARSGTPKDAPEGAGVSEAALGIAGLVGLLGLGAGLELRQGGAPRRRWRWRPPRLPLPRRSS